jgi:hypothetical protein
VILERGRRAEDRHDAVTGELVHRAAVVLDRCGRAFNQSGHDFP